jgi:sugar phosphate isomerase/epimerase
MKSSRRSFIKNTAFTIAGTALLQQKLFATSRQVELTGIQLYSVRDDMKLNPLSTLQQLSKMGYVYVEHANYVDRKFYGWTAKEFRKVLDDLGLKMPSGHTVMRFSHYDDAKKDFTDAWKFTVEDAAVCGQHFVISPSIEESSRKNYDDLRKMLDLFNKSGELCNKSGMKFGYHNHHFEFLESLNGRTMFDIILSETDPKLVMQQLDIGNMINGGAKALDIMKKYPGRFQSMHVKDEIKSNQPNQEEYISTILGKGIIPVKEIIDLGRQWGTTDFIIEQESYQGKAPIDCAKEDLVAMKKWGY